MHEGEILRLDQNDMRGRGRGRFANRPYGGLAERLNVTGDHKGRPYGRNGRGRGMGPRIREDNGGESLVGG